MGGNEAGHSVRLVLQGLPEQNTHRRISRRSSSHPKGKTSTIVSGVVRGPAHAGPSHAGGSCSDIGRSETRIGAGGALLMYGMVRSTSFSTIERVRAMEPLIFLPRITRSIGFQKPSARSVSRSACKPPVTVDACNRRSFATGVAASLNAGLADTFCALRSRCWAP